MALRGQSGANDSGTRVTNPSITYAGAGNIQVGDLIVLATCMDTGGSEGTITDPTGFTAGGSLSPALADISIDTGNAYLHVAVKIAAAGDAGTPTYSTTFANAAFWAQQIFAFSGRKNGSIATAFPNQAATASSAEGNTPVSFNNTGLTASAGDDILVIDGLAFAFGRGTATFAMAITGYSNALATIGSGNNTAALNALSLQNASAGATGTLSASFTSVGGAQTIAIGAFVIAMPAAAAAAASHFLSSLGVGG